MIDKMKLDGLQIAFIITTSIVFIGVVVFLFILFHRKRYTQKNFRDIFYKKVYKIAFSEDFYLINNFLFRFNEEKMANIDHILFGDRYIYLIVDYLYEGDLSGDENNESFIFFDRNGKKFFSPNILNASDELVNRIASLTGIDKSLFIGISLINDRCRIGVESHRKSTFMIQRKRLKKLIKVIESRDVGKFNEEQLHDAVQAINKLNRRNRT